MHRILFLDGKEKKRNMKIFLLLLLKEYGGNSLAVQWLACHTFTVQGPGSVPGQGTKIPSCAAQPKKKEKIQMIMSVCEG